MVYYYPFHSRREMPYFWKTATVNPYTKINVIYQFKGFVWDIALIIPAKTKGITDYMYIVDWKVSKAKNKKICLTLVSKFDTNWPNIEQVIMSCAIWHSCEWEGYGLFSLIIIQKLSPSNL